MSTICGKIILQDEFKVTIFLQQYMSGLELVTGVHYTVNGKVIKEKKNWK
jgi:hypothetical protein